MWSNFIAEKFSKKALGYDKFASVQKFVAQHLYKTVSENINLTPTKILEIGCGTGILSRYLSSAFPASLFEFLDPAQAMLSVCEKNLSEYQKLDLSKSHYKFIDKNIEDYINDEKFYSNKYSLIASSFALHWVENLPFVINKLIDNLEIGGQFFFSIPSNKSFPEWKSVCQKLKLPFTGNVLPDAKQLSACISSDRAGMVWQEYCYKSKFADALEFFREMKQLGADTVISKQDLDKNIISQQLSVSKFRNLIRSWNQMQQTGNNGADSIEMINTYNRVVDCTYWLIEGIITRHK